MQRRIRSKRKTRRNPHSGSKSSRLEGYKLVIQRERSGLPKGEVGTVTKVDKLLRLINIEKTYAAKSKVLHEAMEHAVRGGMKKAEFARMFDKRIMGELGPGVENKKRLYLDFSRRWMSTKKIVKNEER